MKKANTFHRNQSEKTEDTRKTCGGKLPRCFEFSNFLLSIFVKSDITIFCLEVSEFVNSPTVSDFFV